MSQFVLGHSFREYYLGLFLYIQSDAGLPKLEDHLYLAAEVLSLLLHKTSASLLVTTMASQRWPIIYIMKPVFRAFWGKLISHENEELPCRDWTRVSDTLQSNPLTPWHALLASFLSLWNLNIKTRYLLDIEAHDINTRHFYINLCTPKNWDITPLSHPNEKAGLYRLTRFSGCRYWYKKPKISYNIVT